MQARPPGLLRLETSAMSKIAYSVAEAVKVTGIGRTTLYAAIKSGRLQTRKIGRRRIVIADQLRAWLEAAHDDSADLAHRRMGARQEV
jgi:excisionase family DNA binding protein